MSKQTETLLVTNAKLGSLQTDTKTPEKDALRLRKQAAAKQRASLVEQMRALKTEEDSICRHSTRLQLHGSPGQSEIQGASLVTPADAEYWSDSALQDAAAMLVKGDADLDEQRVGHPSLLRRDGERQHRLLLL